MDFDDVVLSFSDRLIQVLYPLKDALDIALKVFRVPSERGQRRVQHLINRGNLVLKQPVFLLNCTSLQVVVEIHNLIQRIVVSPEVFKASKEFRDRLRDLSLWKIFLEVLRLLQTFQCFSSKVDFQNPSLFVSNHQWSVQSFMGLLVNTVDPPEEYFLLIVGQEDVKLLVFPGDHLGILAMANWVIQSCERMHGSERFFPHLK